MLFENADASLRVDTFLLSCRALGRGVEDRMMGNLKRWAVERGVEQIVIPVAPTARNRPALEFLSRLCELPPDLKSPFECVLSVARGAPEWRPTAGPSPVAGAAPVREVSRSPNTDGELVHIAGQLQSAAAIVAAARNRKKRRPTDAGPFVAPSYGIEETLAQIWSECLAIEPIGAKDNFFDFGGHSLIATRILARVRSELGIDMTLTDLFEKPTVGEMAQHISQALSQGSVAR